jgi:hypothetical protein
MNFAMRLLGRDWRNAGATATESQEMFIRQYCADNPLRTYVEACLALYGSLPVLTENRSEYMRRIS